MFHPRTGPHQTNGYDQAVLAVLAATELPLRESEVAETLTGRVCRREVNGHLRVFLDRGWVTRCWHARIGAPATSKPSYHWELTETGRTVAADVAAVGVS